jgi:hypothetical protein
MHTNVVRLTGFFVLAVAGACSSATEVTAPAPEIPKYSCLANAATMRLPAALRGTLPTFGPRNPDDAFVAISHSVPGGFAGVFIEDEKLVMTFVDPVTANRARPVIQEAFTSRGFGGADFDVRKAEFRGARWTFAELDEWYRYITPRIGGPSSGISSFDIDEKANTVALGVIDEPTRANVEAQLSTLGVSCNLVTTVIRPYIDIL